MGGQGIRRPDPRGVDAAAAVLDDQVFRVAQPVIVVAAPADKGVASPAAFEFIGARGSGKSFSEPIASHIGEASLIGLGKHGSSKGPIGHDTPPEI